MRQIVAACLAAWFIGAYAGAPIQASEVQASEALSLEGAIVRALNVAPSLRGSEEDIRAASAGIAQARVRPNPELGMEAENIAGSGAFNGLDGGEYTLSVRQRFERGGKRVARVALARSDATLARHRKDQARLRLIHTVQQGYIEVLATAAVVENARARATLADELEAAVAKRVESARDPATAVQRAALQALEARTDLDQSLRALNMAKRQLAALWGAPSADFQLDGDALSNLGAEEAFAPNEDDGMTPDLALAEAARARAAAAAELERAKAKQDPTVSLGVRHFQDNDEVAGLVSFSMPLALFDTNRGNIERAYAERRRAEWDAVDAQRIFERSHMTLSETLDASRAEARAVSTALIPAAGQALQTAREGYERGAFSYLDVVDSGRVLRDLRAREIAALKKFHLTRAGLDRLTARYREPFPGEEAQP